MARKKDVASEVVGFFEHAPIDVAQAVLSICRGIVLRRQPATARKPRAGRTAAAKDPVVPEEARELLGSARR